MRGSEGDQQVFFSASCEDTAQFWNIYKDEAGLFKFVSSANPVACLDAGEAGRGQAAVQTNCNAANQASQKVRLHTTRGAGPASLFLVTSLNDWPTFARAMHRGLNTRHKFLQTWLPTKTLLHIHTRQPSACLMIQHRPPLHRPSFKKESWQVYQLLRGVWRSRRQDKAQRPSCALICSRDHCLFEHTQRQSLAFSWDWNPCTAVGELPGSLLLLFMLCAGLPTGDVHSDV